MSGLLLFVAALTGAARLIRWACRSAPAAHPRHSGGRCDAGRRKIWLTGTAQIGIGREAMERVEALAVVPGQEVAAGEHVVGQDRLEAETAEAGEARFEPFGVDRTRKGGHADAVTGTGGRRESWSRNQEAGELRKPSSVSLAEAR